MTENQQAEPNMRHIAIVTDTFSPEINGIANTLRHLCSGLMQRGHRISVVRPRQKREPARAAPAASKGLFSDEYVTPSLPLPGHPGLKLGVARTGTLRKLWQRNRPDTIYVATRGPLGLAAITAARQLGIPTSSGCHVNVRAYRHYYWAGYLERLLNRYGRWFHNRTDMTLAPTRKMQAELSASGITNTGLWGHGVDCNRFAPHKRDITLRASWGLAPQDRAVIYVGRLTVEKNLQIATACFERLRSLHPGSRFVLVGDGPLKQRLADRHPDYIFCGVQQGEALARHFASGDIFLFPSKTDSFGNVVPEAMASGLGIVAYNDAAASEHIRHEENGMSVPLTDDEGFISSALKLADQPTLLARVKTQARRDALDLGWSQQVEQFEQLVLRQLPRANYRAPAPRPLLVKQPELHHRR